MILTQRELELDRRTAELVVVGTIAIAICIRLVPDKVENFCTLILTPYPFTFILALVIASALIHAIMRNGEVLRCILHRLGMKTNTKIVFAEENVALKQDVLIIKGRGKAEGFVLFELKGVHVDVLQRPNSALASAMHARGISSSIDILLNGDSGPRILYCIKTKGRARKIEALVKETEAKAKAF